MAQTVRVRGTIEHAEGNALTLKSSDGADLKVTLNDKTMIVAVVKASMADIKEGTFLGSAAMPQPDGSQKALEVHIFPEAMRGTGDGHRPWDLAPQATMTNANVEQTVAGNDGHTLTILRKENGRWLLARDANLLAPVQRRA